MNRVSRFFLYFTLILAALYALAPMWIMLSTSLKTLDEIREGSLIAAPHAPTIEPWLKAWGTACSGVRCEGLKPFFLNSLPKELHKLFRRISACSFGDVRRNRDGAAPNLCREPIHFLTRKCSGFPVNHLDQEDSLLPDNKLTVIGRRNHVFRSMYMALTSWMSKGVQLEHDPRPTTHDPRFSGARVDPRPTTHGLAVFGSIHDPRPTIHAFRSRSSTP